MENDASEPEFMPELLQMYECGYTSLQSLVQEDFHAMFII